MKASFYDDLSARGLIQQVSDPKVRELIDRSSITVYVGFDPTSNSLHMGSLIGLITLRRFQLAGHRPIVLVGGATGMIGDPGGKSQERNLQSAEQVAENVKGISKVVARFVELDGKSGLLLNNLDWIGKMSIVDYLRDVGKKFTVNYMMAKESVRARLEDREQGISFTEFSYMTMQSYDFHFLNKNHQCVLQMGGTDQWGNITAGIDYIRRASEDDDYAAYGLVWPLLTKADGSKYGKTEQGAVWLSSDRTSPYDLYQFLIRTTDADVIPLLKKFTFLSLEEISQLEKSLQTEPEKREAQAALARELTVLIHGQQEYDRVKEASQGLFNSDLKSLDPKALLEIMGDAPTTHKSKSDLEAGIGIVEILAETKVCSSKGEARKDIQGGGIYLNNERVTDVQLKLSPADLIANRYVVLRKGKKKQHLISFE